MGPSGSSRTVCEPPVYHEEQHVRQWWLWTIVLAIAALGWWSFIQQIIFGRPFGNNPAPDWGVWLLWLAIGLGLPLLFGRMKLVLEVTRGEVVVRYSPLSTRVIPFVGIGGLEVRVSGVGTLAQLARVAMWGIW